MGLNASLHPESKEKSAPHTAIDKNIDFAAINVSLFLFNTIVSLTFVEFYCSLLVKLSSLSQFRSWSWTETKIESWI